jgi:hypothetical protein
MLGLPNQGASPADVAADDNAPLHPISVCVLTGPLVANARAGRDRFLQPDFPQRTDTPACPRVEIAIGVILSGSSLSRTAT